MLRAQWDHTVLPATQWNPHVWAEQGLEHFIRNELVHVASHLPTLEGWKPESNYLPGSGSELAEVRRINFFSRSTDWIIN